MSGISIKRARRELHSLIQRFESRRIADADVRKLTAGKLYEFYVLSKTVEELRGRGFNVSFNGKILKFKQSPSMIQPGDTHFRIQHPATGQSFNMYTDVEVRTLGSTITGSSGLCSYHEIDIVVVFDGVIGRPSHDEIALGVECKSHAKFTKSIVKEVLGIKREISYYSHDSMSILAQASRQLGPIVPSKPPLEYWLCYADPKGDQYRVSPSAFGIEFKNWAP